jgi:molecular chaperone DnaK (HSP70)
MSDQQSAAPIFGIDLGTTYSVIAYIDQYNRPAVIPNAAGDRTTPSVVQFVGAERIVGKEAKNNAALYPDSTVQMIKRYMGSPSYTFIYDGVTYTPEEISSYILRKLVQDAEQYTGLTIQDVVITCPAYFGIPEREATARAGEIAGLNVRSIINEPTAAAIAYGVNEQEGDQVVLVYDLGGGTFDVTLIEIKDGNITVVATDGDHFLGGRNWDEAVVTFLAGEWQRETGSADDPTDSLETLEDLLLKAETAKQTLTTRAQTDVRVVHNGLTARVTLTREKFDELTQHLLDRTVELTRQALAEAAKRGYTRFDQLLLVGGATRMPQVAARLMTAFDTEPRIYEPDEAVAKGAAIYGQKLALDQEIKIRIAAALGVEDEAAVDMSTTDDALMEQIQQQVAEARGLQLGALKTLASQTIRNVTSRTFGIVAWDPSQSKQVVSNLILRNDPVPAEVTREYGTRDANQESVLIQIVDNLSSDAIYDTEGSRDIGSAELTLPPGLPAGAPVAVTFRLDEQGRLHMTARELTGGREVEVTIQTEAGSSEEELEKAAERSKSLVIS